MSEFAFFWDSFQKNQANKPF